MSRKPTGSERLNSLEMARRSNRDTPEVLRKKLLQLIEAFELKLQDEDLRSQVVALIPANHMLRDLGSSLIADGSTDSARGRILSYLLKYPKTILHGDELMIVAGISEYGRRIRELRVQYGWAIASGQAVAEMMDEDGVLSFTGGMESLTTDSYVLLSDVQDLEGAHRWNVANDIRKGEGSAQSKILDFFRCNVGKEVTGEELRYVANGSTEWARRVRELRTEQGWPILTRVTGMPELPIGVYLLEADKQAAVHDRSIPDPVKVRALERDGFACRSCGWSRATSDASDRYRTQIELHHIQHHVDGGENTADNLVSLCNVCHDDVHRGGISNEQLISFFSNG